MRTLAIINQKGGCGKTTVAINLAACLARLGHPTLLVDMDPQGHCATGLAVPERQVRRTVLDALLPAGVPDADDAPASLADITWQIATNFDLAPSDLRLAAFEQLLAGRSGRESRLAAALDAVRDRYAWCVLDCPPGVGLLTFNALVACDEAVVPVETGYFSLHGLTKMIETLDELKARIGKDTPVRVLPTLYDTRTKLAREVMAELRGRFGGLLMRSCVHFNAKLKEAASFGQAITEYDPGSRGYRDFVDLARELMGADAVATPTTTVIDDEPLSRPAELVHRARQLAQFSARNFPASGGSRKPPAPTAFVAAEQPRPVARPAGLTLGARVRPETTCGVRPVGDGLDVLVRFPDARDVHIAGDFNAWDADAGILIRVGDSDAFHARLPAPVGRHRYRFVVDGDWHNDPHGGEIERNDFGEFNNVVVVPDRRRTHDARTCAA